MFFIVNHHSVDEKEIAVAYVCRETDPPGQTRDAACHVAGFSNAALGNGDG